MALTTDINPGRPRFYYVVGDRKTMHLMIRDAEPIEPALAALDFAFNHDGLLGAGWYRQVYTEDDLFEVLAALDALPEPVTIQADLLRLYWAHTGHGPAGAA